MPQCEFKEFLLDSCAPDLRLRLQFEARTAGGNRYQDFVTRKEQALCLPLSKKSQPDCC